jgi:CheY-like chemotaxis protein
MNWVHIWVIDQRSWTLCISRRASTSRSSSSSARSSPHRHDGRRRARTPRPHAAGTRTTRRPAIDRMVLGSVGNSLTMRRILIVDDDPGIVALATAVLRRNGDRIDVAASGEEALARLADVPVDVVVLDVEMPGLSGWETLRAIRRDPALAAVRVVIHSASGPLIPPRRSDPRPDGLLAKGGPLQGLRDAVERACPARPRRGRQ